MLEVVLTHDGPWALIVMLLAGGLWLVASGRWVPRSHLREMERINRLVWQAYEHEHEARTVADKQLGEMLELGRTTTHVLTALPTPQPAAPDGGDKDASAVA